MKKLVLGMALMLIACCAFGADVDGKWTAEMPGMDGSPMTITYNFKAEGTTLTGSSIGPDGTATPLTKGKIDGKNISFTIALDFGGQEFEMPYTGVVEANEIKLTMDMGMGEPMQFTLKKAQ